MNIIEIYNYSYDELKAGLYAYYHYEALRSKTFIPQNRSKSEKSLKPEDVVSLIADCLNILKKIKNPRIKAWLLLQAQGFTEEEISQKIDISASTINQYRKKIKNILKKMEVKC